MSLFLPGKDALDCQYVPSKRSHYGIKIYKLCESNSRYVWNFLVYSGKDTNIMANDGSYGERVVKTLMTDLSSLSLVQRLRISEIFTEDYIAD